MAFGKPAQPLAALQVGCRGREKVPFWDAMGGHAIMQGTPLAFQSQGGGIFYSLLWHESAEESLCKAMVERNPTLLQ